MVYPQWSQIQADMFVYIQFQTQLKHKFPVLPNSEALQMEEKEKAMEDSESL